MTGRILLANGRERAEFGCITTWENADGRTFTIHRPGSPLKGLKKAIEIVVILDPTFRLVSYSTPESIFTDMGGHRVPTDRSRDERQGALPQMPEAAVLGRIGRGDMLHPRLALSRRSG